MAVWHAMNKSVSVEKLEQDFKKLPLREQAEAFERFARIVYEENNEDAAFTETLRKRVAEIDSGAITARDAFEVLGEIKAKHSRSSQSPR